MAGISSDQIMRFSASPKRRTHKRAFTVVELLVVIGIMCILIAILFPLLGRITETGRRTKCAANLHTIGQMATLFANDHNGFFPACYRMRDIVDATGKPVQAYPFRVPQYITTDTTHDSDNSSVTGWQQYGTSWNLFRQYANAYDGRLYASSTSASGAPNPTYVGDPLFQTFSCPSVEKPAYELDMAGSATPATQAYGNIIVTNYEYVGALSDQNMQVPPTVTAAAGNKQSRSHWGSSPPAVSTSGSPLYVYVATPAGSDNISTVATGQAPLGQTILAADLVFFSGVGAKPLAYKINHPRRGDNTIPDFQNVLYGDGRVEGHTSIEYSNPLNDDSGKDAVTGATITHTNFDWSMKYADGQPGFYYWGEPEATPGLALAPPSNDAAAQDQNTLIVGGGGGGSPPPQPVLPPGLIMPPATIPEGSPSPLPG